VLFLVCGICWLLIGVTINFPPKSPHQKLDEARALWQVKGSPNYQMDFSFASFSSIGGYRIVVHDNQVTDILGYPIYSPNVTPKPLDSDKQKLDQSNFFAESISPDLKQYTVNSLFDIAAAKIANQPVPAVVWCSINAPSPDISFNSEYGYIQSYDLGNCPKFNFGGGLLCPAIGDCYAGMSVRNLTFLPPS
jgi:hypothetical protein